MDPEEVLNLFDSCWFNLEIFSTHPSFASIASKFTKIPSDNQPRFSSLRSIILRSKSDELTSMSSFNYGSSPINSSQSPNSVLFNFTTSHQLQTILSGKEAKFDTKEEEKHQQQETEEKEQETEAKKSGENQEKAKKITRRRTKVKGTTKSLSDLEFEELKGFMDLGFVFSEKDKDSSLVEIIPGLQRFSEKLDGSVTPNSKIQQKIVSSSSSNSVQNKVESKSASNSGSRRPYLSEAWENLDRRKNLSPNPMLMNWRMPSLSNEVDVKDSLKLWAHSVASVVR